MPPAACPPVAVLIEPRVGAPFVKQSVAPGAAHPEQETTMSSSLSPGESAPADQRAAGSADLTHLHVFQGAREPRGRSGKPADGRRRWPSGAGAGDPLQPTGSGRQERAAAIGTKAAVDFPPFVAEHKGVVLVLIGMELLCPAGQPALDGHSTAKVQTRATRLPQAHHKHGGTAPKGNSVLPKETEDTMRHCATSQEGKIAKRAAESPITVQPSPGQFSANPPLCRADRRAVGSGDAGPQNPPLDRCMAGCPRRR